MRKHLILTASGRDRPGILEEVTRLIVSHHGNVENGRFQRLGGDFAMLMYVSAPSEELAHLRRALDELHFARFDVQTRLSEAAEPSLGSGSTTCAINVMGADHMGIIYEVTHYLAEQGINVETMTTEVVAAPMSGAPLFTMSAVVRVPGKLSIEDLREALEFIGDEVGVDTQVFAEEPADEKAIPPA